MIMTWSPLSERQFLNRNRPTRFIKWSVVIIIVYIYIYCRQESPLVESLLFEMLFSILTTRSKMSSWIWFPS